MAVVEHSTIDNSFMLFGKMLEVLIVGGDDSKGFFLPKLFHYGFSNSSTYLWLSACTEFVDEKECILVAVAYHLFHVLQVRRICAQVVFNALFVADVYHNVFENTCFRAVANAHGKSALKHILQQSYRFQTHRLSSSVRS